MRIDWDYIEDIRKSKKIEVVQICGSLQINKGTYSKWKNGTMIPSAIRFKKLCDLLNVDINDMFID